MPVDFSQNVFYDPARGHYWALQGNVQRPITGDVSSLGGNIQNKSFGQPINGSSTTGGTISVDQYKRDIQNNFENQLPQSAIQSYTQNDIQNPNNILVSKGNNAQLLIPQDKLNDFLSVGYQQINKPTQQTPQAGGNQAQTLTPELYAQIHPNQGFPANYDWGNKFKISDLPPEQQKAMQGLLSEYDKQQQQKQWNIVTGGTMGAFTGSPEQLKVLQNAGFGQSGQPVQSPAPQPSTPPAGSTLILNPSGLAGLTEKDIWRDPNSNNIYKLASANNISVGTPVTNSATTQKTNITADNGFTNTNLTQLPNATSGASANTNATAESNSFQANLKSVQDTLNANKTAEQTQFAGLTDTMVKELGLESGKSAFETEQRTAKEDAFNTQLNTVNNQITAYKDEQRKALEDVNGRSMTLAQASGEKARLNAMYDSKILSLTAQGNMLMNNIALAEKQIKQAVEAKYGPIEEAYATAKAQRDAIEPLVNKQEKMQLDILNASDAEKKQQIADAKAEEIKIQSVALDYIKAAKDAGVVPDANIVSNIANAKTYGSAVSLYGTNAPAVNQNVSELIKKYPDAGITTKDTFEQAKVKLSGSRIYQNQVKNSSDTNNLTKEEQAFQKDLSDALKSLAGGGDWENTWNYMKARYNTPDATLGIILHKDIFGPKSDQSSSISKVWNSIKNIWP